MQILTQISSTLVSEEFTVYNTYRQSPGNDTEACSSSSKDMETSQLKSFKQPALHSFPQAKPQIRAQGEKGNRPFLWDEKYLFAEGFPIHTVSGVHGSLLA